MDPFDHQMTDLIWQRVRAREETGFHAMARQEEAIARQCRGLYRTGFAKKQMDLLYRQSRARQRALEGMARQAGEADHHHQTPSRKAQVGTLLELLGRAAWSYDPDHPIYGPVFAQMRQECAAGQRMILEATGAKRKTI